MKPDFICDDSDRAVWLEARRSGVGGSDCPIVLGISSWKESSVAMLANEKRGLLPINEEQTELQEWGHVVEGPLLARFLRDKEKAGEKGWDAKLSGKLYRCATPGRDFMIATLDGQVKDPAGRVGTAQCKLKYNGAEWERSGVPDDVLAQCQHEAAVADAPFFVVLVLLDRYRPRWKVIERDDEMLGDVIVPAERNFWNRLQSGEPFPLGVEGRPEADASLLRYLHPNDDGTTIKLEGDDWLYVVRQWRSVASVASDNTKLAKELKTRIQAAMGSSTFARFDNGTVLSNKTTSKGAATHKASTYRSLKEMTDKAARKAGIR